MKIKFVPNILTHERRQEKESAYVPGKLVREYIDDAGFPLEGMRVVVSGKVAESLAFEPQAHDEILITPDVKLPLIQVVYYVVMIISVIMAIKSAFQKPRQPAFNTNAGNADSLDSGSPTYGWDGIQLTTNVGTAVPIVYGEHRIGGNVINQFITTDGDKNYLNTLIALSEGEIESISEIQINDNDSANFDGIDTVTRMGTNSQTAIPDFGDLHNLVDVSVNLNTASATHTYNTADSDVEAFEVHLLFPNGLFQQNTENGSINSYTVSVKIEYKLHSSGTWIELGTFDINERSRSAVRRIYRKDGLTAGAYDIRLTRMSAVSDFDHTGDMTWRYLDEIKTDDLIYPNTALLGIKLLATDQLSGGLPNITSLVKGRKVSVPDIRVTMGGAAVAWDDYYFKPSDSTWRRFSDDATLYWDGTTYVNAYSANPIWCVRDMLTNTRYGLGDFITVANINTAQYLEMAKYCDEKVPDGNGGYEKRFHLDVVIDSANRALDVLIQLAGTFRGIFYFSEGAVNVRIDKPETPVQLFGMGNIVAGSFQEAWKSVKEIPNVVEVQFLDRDKNYQQEVIAWIDEDALTAGDVMRKKQIRLFCTRASQALREARYYGKLAKLSNRTVNYKAGIDAVAMQVGDVFNFAHDQPQWGLSGRIIAGSTTTSVKLDQEVTILPATTYKLRVRLSNDTVEERTVTNSAGTTDTITVSVAFSSAPAAYDVYAFGVQSVLVKPFRAMNLSRESGSEVMIQAIEYDANIYDDSDIVLPESNFSQLTTEIADVENLSVTEGVVMSADGTIINTIDVWFTKPDTAGIAFDYAFKEAKIFYSDNAQASWIYAGKTTAQHFQIPGLQVGSTYHVAVVSVANNDMENSISASPKTSITLDGKTAEPSSVSNFAYVITDKLRLTWSPVADPDLIEYEIRDQNSNFGTDDSHLIYRGRATYKIIEVSSRTPGTYYIRARNSSGLYSLTSASVTPNNSAPAAITGVAHDMFFNVANLYWTNNADADIVKYQIYLSQTDAWAGEEILYGESQGKAITIEGRRPRTGVITQVTNAGQFKVDALAGLPDDYFNKDWLEMTSGAGDGDQNYVSDFVGATGEIFLGVNLSHTPSIGDQVVIYDRVFVKVRAVDFFGPGTLSSSHTIQYEQVTEEMLGDNTVTARKIFVGCLSAISANMGTLTGGVIQGGTFQTGSGGQRLMFDSTGMRGYDSSCCQNLCIDTQGCITARQLRLQDPACCCNYSYVDAGALKFHDKLGDVPYIKRIADGCTNTGCWVELNGWTTAPKVLVTANTLNSFDKDHAGQTQQWKIYADGLTSYNTSDLCYGYCFQVHAALQLATAQGAETVRAADFGTVYSSTANNVCSSIQRMSFQLWCHAAAPAAWCYGCIAFRICYRCAGCVTWQGSCDYSYTQPHANTTEMSTTYTCAFTLNLPSAQCWEFIACCVSLSWTSSGIASGSTTCFLCTRALTATSTCSCVSSGCVTTAGRCCLSNSSAVCVTLAGTDPTLSCVFCVYACTCWCSVTTCNLRVLQCRAFCSTEAFCGIAEACLRSPYIDVRSERISQCILGVSGTFCCDCNYSFTCTATCFDLSAYKACTFTKFCLCTANCVEFTLNASNCGFACGVTTANVCFLGGNLFQCYCVLSGGADSCTLMCAHSLCDTYATQCILDPAGVVNWLAIAYS